MIPGPQEHSRDSRGFQPVEERLIVRHDDGTVRHREFEERIVRGTVSLDRAVLLREACGGARITIVIRHQCELRQDRARNGDLDVAQDAMELRLKVDLELERHEQRIRVEQDESGHRFRPSVLKYMGS